MCQNSDFFNGNRLSTVLKKWRHVLCPVHRLPIRWLYDCHMVCQAAYCTCSCLYQSMTSDLKAPSMKSSPTFVKAPAHKPLFDERRSERTVVILFCEYVPFLWASEYSTHTILRVRQHICCKALAETLLRVFFLACRGVTRSAQAGLENSDGKRDFVAKLLSFFYCIVLCGWCSGNVFAVILHIKVSCKSPPPCLRPSLARIFKQCFNYTRTNQPKCRLYTSLC